MQKMITILLTIFISGSLFAQSADSLKNDVIQVNYNKKSTFAAAAASMIFPGAGQFYVDNKSITAYIFPVIEIGLILGYLHYNNEGDKKTEKYEKFADKNYSRVHQVEVEGKIIAAAAEAIPEGTGNIYDYTSDDIQHDNRYFLLDSQKTQHYYEDIGKYNKYIFGWDDWYSKYIDPEDGTALWQFNDNVWVGNYPVNIADADYETPYSALRKEYNVLREDAEEEYRAAKTFVYGIMFNHLLASADAIRVSVKHNSEYISDNNVKFNFKTALIEKNITPMLCLTKRF